MTCWFTSPSTEVDSSSDCNTQKENISTESNIKMDSKTNHESSSGDIEEIKVTDRDCKVSMLLLVFFLPIFYKNNLYFFSQWKLENNLKINLSKRDDQLGCQRNWLAMK